MSERNPEIRKPEISLPLFEQAALCQCGCGQEAVGYKGAKLRFLHGHNTRKREDHPCVKCGAVIISGSNCKECKRACDRRIYRAKREAGLLVGRKSTHRPGYQTWYSANKEDRTKKKCRHTTQNAVASGKLKRLPCEHCGNPKSQAHHEDYTKPLEVKWLCDLCHRLEHTMSGHKKFTTLAQVGGM